MSKIILLVGPTGVGKTNISIKLAHKYNAEIINADSRYIYKEPLIATAKVTDEEMDGIKHHMINTISLDDDYSIYNYQNDGRKILDKLISENKNIIIVGGSGLYVKALLYDYKLNAVKNKNIDFSSLTNEELKLKADLIDINNNIHVNNRKRLERFITYYYESGNTITKNESGNKKIYNFICFCLVTDRNILYDRINKRVDIMFDNGLLNEATKFKHLKHFNEIIGYKEINNYFNNLCTIDEAKEDIKKNSRHYAKRQMTWFNNQMDDVNYINMNYSDINKSLDEIINIIDNN